MKLLTLLLIFYLAYRLMRFFLRTTFRILPQAGAPQPGQPQSGAHQQALQKDTIVACPSCGTYNPQGSALLVGGEYFCCEACYQQRRKS